MEEVVKKKEAKFGIIALSIFYIFISALMIIASGYKIASNSYMIDNVIALILNLAMFISAIGMIVKNKTGFKVFTATIAMLAGEAMAISISELVNNYHGFSSIRVIISLALISYLISEGVFNRFEMELDDNIRKDIYSIFGVISVIMLIVQFS
ncbi:MAG: hypothetical protein N4A47_04135 [Clostridia bacterium]|jgi:hypothetical protein|nr:hypothetical protein [Clostridia bacterium]